MPPIRLTRRTVTKPWGRRDLPAALDSADAPIGEIWFEHPNRALPILIKWLFTSDRLSVQVHPDDAQAAASGLPSGKEECWVVVDAEPGATLGIGTRKPLHAEALRAAALSGDIVELLDWKPVVAGDWFHIAPGTVHAIGAGVTLVEVQQFADVTYRLFDYGRARALHVDDGVAVSRAEPYNDPRHGRLGPQGAARLLSRCASFTLWHAGGAALADLPATDLWLVPLAGRIDLEGVIAGPGDILYGPIGTAVTSVDFACLIVMATAP
ncbi:MAG: hypothetical protein CFE37_00335 [Alphaproteobacteria bacterium PA4]|nr:MAG: hypothetical protein CFE37_00335 [Alphaproteobacteria bacterium PA4]